jgi:hypothetical protein
VGQVSRGAESPEANTYFGTERINPKVAQALPKYVIGTGLVIGFAPGCAREVMGQEPSVLCLPTRNDTARCTSLRPLFAPAKLRK